MTVANACNYCAQMFAEGEERKVMDGKPYHPHCEEKRRLEIDNPAPNEELLLPQG
jgi:hypothetical protein